MKREIPGYVRELPIAILILALVLASVFWPLYSRYYRKKAEENRARDAQKMKNTMDDSDEPGSDGDAESYSD